MSEATRVAASDGSGRETRPPCFGDPGRVCPKDASGNIKPQVDCVACTVFRECLQKALKREGMICDPPATSQAVSKATHFLKRWSDRKLARSDRGNSPAG